MKNFSAEQVGPAFRGEFSENPVQKFQEEPVEENVDAQEAISEPSKPKKRKRPAGKKSSK